MREPEDQSNDFIDVLSRTLPANAPVALLDFPWHGNPGDAAIWKGETLALQRLGHRVLYTSTVDSFEQSRLDRLLPPNGFVLLHGGGNFGDLWPFIHSHREAVIAQLHERPIVQLPQTVEFADRESGDASLALLGAHPNLTVLVRDTPSLDRLRTAGLEACLSSDPTTALWTGTTTPPLHGRAPRVLFLLRSDHERSVSLPSQLETRARDWSDLGIDGATRGPTQVVDRSLTVLDRLQDRAGRALPATCWPRMANYRPHSNRLVAKALAAISAYDIIVTDRLHGMLLALALGRSVVAIESGYGKISNYAESFLGRNPLLQVLPDFNNLEAVLDTLVKD